MHNMHGGYNGYDFWFGGEIIMGLLFLGAVGALIYLVIKVKKLTKANKELASNKVNNKVGNKAVKVNSKKASTEVVEETNTEAIKIAEVRYAKGEITFEELETIKNNLNNTNNKSIADTEDTESSKDNEDSKNIE